jgi:hypothetical protein
VGEVEIATDDRFRLTGDTAVIKESFKASIDGAPVAVGEVISGDLTLKRGRYVARPSTRQQRNR